MGYLITFYFIALDFITGLLKAFYTGTFSSKVMRKGLFHKASLLGVMALGWLVEYAQRFVDLGIDFVIPAGGAACGYIILMEVCSSLENLCQSNPELMPGKLYEIFGVAGEPQAPVDKGTPTGADSLRLEPKSRDRAKEPWWDVPRQKEPAGEPPQEAKESPEEDEEEDEDQPSES